MTEVVMLTTGLVPKVKAARRSLRLRAYAVAARVGCRLSASPRWAYRRARYEAKLGRYSSARQAYEIALERAPERIAWHCELGELLYSHDDAAEGEQRFKEASERAPHDDRVHIRHGKILESTGNLAQAEDAYRRAIGINDGYPGRFAALARVLDGQGDNDGAYAALRSALAYDPENVKWLERASHLAGRLGDDEGADQTDRRLVELATGSRSRAALKRIVGRLRERRRYAEALEEVEAYLRSSPDDLAGLRLLELVLRELDEWGGYFAGSDASSPPQWTPLPERDAQGGHTHPSIRRRRREVLERLTELRPERPIWRVQLAEVLASEGTLTRAIDQLETAVVAARRTPERWGWRQLHRWQFLLERTRREAGHPLVDDPLFDIELTPATDASHERTPPPGFFTAAVYVDGIRLAGWCMNESVRRVAVVVDGRVLREIRLDASARYPDFGFTLRRSTIELLPPRCSIEVVTDGGQKLRAPQGATALMVDFEHGSGALHEVLDAGAVIDKKGVLVPGADEIRRRQDDFIDLYAEVRSFFEGELDRPLLLLYGTLLGVVREGDLIADDDDFDVGYISDATEPNGVLAELKGLIEQLVRAGFIVSFNRRGRLFRVEREADTAVGLHLDIRPMWFEGGNVWLHNQVSFPATVDDFLPPKESMLRGTPVALPNNPERFLGAHYGAGWQTPDPAFTYHASDVDPRVRRHLRRILLDPETFREWRDEIAKNTGDDQAAERFVATGGIDLYPLNRFVM